MKMIIVQVNLAGGTRLDQIGVLGIQNVGANSYRVYWDGVDYGEVTHNKREHVSHLVAAAMTLVAGVQRDGW